MTTLSVLCDRCGLPIDHDRSKLVLACGSTRAPWTIDPTTGRPTLDLCPACMDALAGWLAVGTAPATSSGRG